nr:hypothetical protein [uncultured Prevotella sp.]
MKRFTSTRLFAIVCMIVMGFVQTWAQNKTTVTVKAPTITPGSCEYNGTIMPVITADEGCSIVYVKSTSKLYTTVEDIDKNQGVKTENSNKATITDIINKTGNRYISAYATKDVNGQTYKSAVTNVTYTYNKDANTKTDITLSASPIKLDMANPNATQNLNIIAKDAKGNTISGLTYSFTVYPEGIVTVASDGTVTPKAAGTASINVIFEGNDNYNAATCVANVNVASNTASTTRVFTSIADVRHVAQDNGKKLEPFAITFNENNPATVIAVLKESDKQINDDDKVLNSFFIIDNSNRGLWVSPSGIKGYTLPTDLAIGSKITGTIVGTYTEGTKGIPMLWKIQASATLDNMTYTTHLSVDHDGEAHDDIPATYPYTAVKDVQTIANNNIKDDIVNSSYGVYLNSIVSVPGTIKLGADDVFYLMQDENTNPNGNYDKRLAINTDQIGVNLADYVNTSGTFEGILYKLNGNYAKLVVLKNNFFQINKIYLDENDDENRIDDLVNAGAFDDEVDVYVHRTKLVNTTANAWNTLCFPFDLSAEEFNTAFGCTLSALAKPKVNTEETINGRLTKIGEVDSNNNLLFNTVEDLSIEEGIPYLMKAEGTQKYGINPSTNISIKDKTPQELIDAEPNYYAHIGQKMITVVPPHQIQGEINNKIVGGKFYLRGLYGSKQYANNADGSLSTTTVADNGSQKYQYISTSEHNYLKYLKKDATAKFPGFRAYFYFPYWSSVENNKAQANPANNTINAKVFLLVDDSTTGISDIRTDENHNDGRIYNLAGQVVDASYKGIIIKNGRKYLAK